MLTKMQNFLRTTWGHVHTTTVAGLPKLSGAELARSSWAKLIESYADVPVAYQDFFCPFFVDGLAFPYTILTPSHERFIHRTSEKLICAIDSKLYIVERIGNSLKTQFYPYDGISYVEYKTALLASSLKICGKTGKEDYAITTLKFNSVTDYLFTPILNKLRAAKIDSTKSSETLVPQWFDHLIKVNFKFMNYARRSLREGENVLHFVLQPEIRERLITVLGKTYSRTVSPTHMLILTDRELILIQEELTRRREDRYGGIWNYIPSSKITSISLAENESNLLTLSIQLHGNVRFELFYQESARGEVNQLLDQIK